MQTATMQLKDYITTEAGLQTYELFVLLNSDIPLNWATLKKHPVLSLAHHVLSSALDQHNSQIWNY